METLDNFGELAPVINVVNIAGCLNPKLVDSDTITAIAQSTGTPEELVECVVEAVDTVNTMIGEGTNPEVAIQNFSNGIKYLAEACKGMKTNKPYCGPQAIAKIAFALHTEDLARFSSGELAENICQFVPADFNTVKETIANVKYGKDNLNKKKGGSKNFSRENYSAAAIGKALAQAATTALNAGKNIATKVTSNPAAKEIATRALQTKDAMKSALENSETVKTVTSTASKSAQALKHQAAPAWEAGKKLAGEAATAVKAELPAVGESLKTVGKEAKQLAKDLVHNPFAMGLNSELANVGRLKEQKVITETAAKFLNEVKGATAYDLSNTTLEVDLIRDNIMRTKDTMARIAKQVKNGQISKEYFDSIAKDFKNLLIRNNKTLKNIKTDSLNKIQKLAQKNNEFIQGASDLLGKSQSGLLDAEAFEKNFERLLKGVKGSSGAKALADFKNTANKTSAANNIIKNARAEATKYSKEIEKIVKNFETVENLARTELATAAPNAAAAIAEANPKALLTAIKKLPESARKMFTIEGVKSCTPAVKAASPLNQEYKKVIGEAKSVLGKSAAVLGLSAIPVGLLAYGFTRDEDKALRFMVARAEAYQAEINQLENKINQDKDALESARRELYVQDPKRSSADILAGLVYSQNFSRQNYALSDVLKAVGSKLLFPIAPAILFAAATLLGVGAVKDKIEKIRYREMLLEDELVALVAKRNELQAQLDEINQSTRRFRLGEDFYGKLG